MGMNRDIITAVGSVGRSDIEYRGKGFFIPPKPAASPGYVVVIDATSWMHSRSSPFLPDLAQTVGGLVSHFQAKLNRYLMDDSVEGVVFLLDAGTPKNKTITRKEKPGETPETPFADRSIAKTATLRISMTAWAEKLARDIVQYDDDRAGDRTVLTPATELNFQLPLRSEDLRNRIAANPDYFGFSYEQHLTNKAFKRLLIDIVLRNLLDGLIVPDGRWILARGPEFADGRAGTEGAGLQRDLLRPYEEGDAIAGYYAAIYHEHPILVESIDGDVISNLLLGSWSRLRSKEEVEAAQAANPRDPNLPYRNVVYLVRAQFAVAHKNTFERPEPSGGSNAAYKPQGGNSIVDINRLFSKLNTMLHAFAPSPHNVVWKTSLAPMVAAMMMAGSNDYFDAARLPQIGAESILKTFWLHGSAFGHDFIGQHISTETGYHHIVVNPDSFGRMFVCLYRVRYPKLDLPFDNLAAALRQLLDSPHRKQLEGKLPASPDEVYVLGANLSWTLSYFSASTYRKATPDPFEMQNGLSVWGYELERDGPNEYGHAKARPATKVNVPYLRKRSADLLAYNGSTPSPPLEQRNPIAPNPEHKIPI